jgi:PAS domain-containing protein
MGVRQSGPVYPVLDTTQQMLRAREDLYGVECFVSSVYSSCPRIEAMWLMLSTKLGQKAFHNYCRSENSEELLDLFIATTELLSVVDMDHDLVAHFFDAIVCKLFQAVMPISRMIHEALRDELDSMRALSQENQACRSGTLLALVTRLQGDLVFIMARDLFYSFLHSKEYKKWRAAEKSHAMATTFEDASHSTQQSYSLQSSFASAGTTTTGMGKVSVPSTYSSKHRYRMRTVLRPGDVAATALATVTDSGLQQLINEADGDNWLISLLAASETLPIVFALADGATGGHNSVPGNADPPVVFVNRYTERATGLDRDKALGCGLVDVLCCDHSESWNVDSISDAILNRQSCYLLLTCTSNSHGNSNGKISKHVIAQKPLFDQHNQCRYIVALRLEAGREPASMNARLRLVQELLDMIPDRLHLNNESCELDDPWETATSATSTTAATKATANKSWLPFFSRYGTVPNQLMQQTDSQIVRQPGCE